ncbi:MAG: hypothetical protein WBO28_06800 [Flavobacteriales bacterium]
MNDDIEDRMAFRKSPLFKKGQEIMQLALAIVDAAPDEIRGKDDEESEFETSMLVDTKRDMVGYAYTIPGKLSGAMSVNAYDLQMENACLIRRACRELVVSLRALEIAGHLEEDHFNLLRQAVEEFRPLFADWLDTFKDSDYLWDDWRLFNPPGAFPDLE